MQDACGVYHRETWREVTCIVNGVHAFESCVYVGQSNIHEISEDLVFAGKMDGGLEVR